MGESIYRLVYTCMYVSTKNLPVPQLSSSTTTIRGGVCLTAEMALKTVGAIVRDGACLCLLGNIDRNKAVNKYLMIPKYPTNFCMLSGINMLKFHEQLRHDPEKKQRSQIRNKRLACRFLGDQRVRNVVCFMVPVSRRTCETGNCWSSK